MKTVSAYQCDYCQKYGKNKTRIVVPDRISPSPGPHLPGGRLKPHFLPEHHVEK